MTKKIIILGSNGFIGTNLTRSFSLNPSYEVRGYSSKVCDLLSPKSIENALSGISSDDAIIMASSITRFKENTYNSMMKNIAMAENIGAFVERHRAGYFIFLSTVDVYGFIEGKISEELLPQPRDHYAVSKFSSEFILKNYCFKGNVPLLILRLSGVYGPGDHDKSTINYIIESISAKQRGAIWGDGKDKRDFVYVDDIYRVINMAIDKKTEMTLNIATGRSYSINEIFEIIKCYYRGKFVVEYKPREKPTERVKYMVYDISLFKKTFPDFKFIDLKEGISLYLKKEGAAG